MSDVIDPRPPVAVGHVRLTVTDVGAAARWLETVGLRPIVTQKELAVLELRGGTHRDYAEKGLSPSPIRRGRIHDSFDLPGPEGWAFTVNSSHASGRPV